MEPRQTKSGFGLGLDLDLDLDLLEGKSESATAGSFDANEDIKQTRDSERVYWPIGKDGSWSDREES